MKKKQLILIVVIGGMILLGLGFCLGVNLGQKQTQSQPDPEIAVPIFQASKVIQNWNGTAVGQVAKIFGRTLTLTTDGDTLNVSIREDAKIQLVSWVGEDKEKAKQETKEIEFKDIKVGDAVNIPIGPKGEIVEGYLVAVTPSEDGTIKK